jgi:hypothetical protein
VRSKSDSVLSIMSCRSVPPIVASSSGLRIDGLHLHTLKRCGACPRGIPRAASVSLNQHPMPSNPPQASRTWASPFSSLPSSPTPPFRNRHDLSSDKAGAVREAESRKSGMPTVAGVLQGAIQQPLPSRLSTFFFPHTHIAQSRQQNRQESRQASLALVGCASPAL